MALALQPFRRDKTVRLQRGNRSKGNVIFDILIALFKSTVLKQQLLHFMVKKLTAEFQEKKIKIEYSRIKTVFFLLQHDKTHLLNLLAFMKCPRKEQAAHGVTPAKKCT